MDERIAAVLAETVTIRVHCCTVCGDHAREETETYPDIDDGRVQSYHVEGIVLERCETCGLWACRSCIDDGFCCDRRAEIEMEGLPGQTKRGQLSLFESDTT